MNTPEAVYPVLFTLSEVVSGNGFVAGVFIEGRGSMVHEEDGWWLYGVEPGILAEDGDTPQEAHLKFASEFKNVLIEIARHAPTFPAFDDEVRQIFSQRNDPEAERWNRAFKAGLRPDDEFLKSLPRKAPIPFRAIVQRLDRQAAVPTPALIKPGELALPKAA